MQKLVRRIIVTVGVLAILVAGFLGYASQYYEADEEAVAVLNQKDVMTEKNWIDLEVEGSDIGFIFYPGAKVEYTAYLPLLERLQDKGVECFLVEMPLNMAIFGSDKAAEVMEAHPEISTWYIGGHSMGGAFASKFASEHKDQIQGVVLLGAYLYGDYPAKQSLTFYGSEDEVLHRDKITYEDNIIELAGANHAQFGNYGEQKGDGKANMSAEAQQDAAAEAVLDFIFENK